MRKLFITLICFATVAAVCACGPKNGKKSASKDGEIDAGKIAENIVKDTFDGDKNTKEAAAFWFKKNFGIGIKDVTPDFAFQTETGKYDFLGEKELSSYVTFVAKDSTLNRDDYIAYVKKVYEATAKVADGGKNVYGWQRALQKKPLRRSRLRLSWTKANPQNFSASSSIREIIPGTL